MESKQDDEAKCPSSKHSSAETNLCRPSTGLARGIQITEYQDARSNPAPVRTDESVTLLEGYLAPQKLVRICADNLRALTGVDDLAKVHFLEMKVDSCETSLGNFGMHLPNLSQLKLSNSIIISMRDLGSSLNNLRILWMARCGTEDLDGVSAMVNLRELYLAYNEISDLSPCGMLENLQILDVEGNNISNISQLTFLVLCQKLSSLTLEGNPVCVAPSPEEADPEYNYRQAVKKLIPHLVTLDDEPLREEEVAEARSTPSSVFAEDWKLIDELMAECPIAFLDESLETGGRPGTSARPRTGTTYRPGSALKPYSASGIRPGSSQPGRSSAFRPGTGSRPESSCSWTGSTGSGNSHSLTQPGFYSIQQMPSYGDQLIRIQSLKIKSIGRKGLVPIQDPEVRQKYSVAAKVGDVWDGTERGIRRRGGIEPSNDDIDPTCELTSGGIVCGSMSTALRKRRQKASDITAKQAEQFLSKFGHKPEHTFDTRLEDDETIRQLSKELKQWKEDHRRRVEEIEKAKAPQILKIEYDEASGVSSDADSEDLSGADDESSGRMEQPDGYTDTSDAAKLFTRYMPLTIAEKRTHIYSPRTIDSGIGSLQSLQSVHQTPDESVEVDETELETFDPLVNSASVSLSFSSALPGPEERRRCHGLPGVHEPVPPLSMTRKYSEPFRPVTGPVLTTRRKFRLEPQVDKAQPKVIDPVHPIIRCSVHSPEGHVSDVPRAGTSRAALAHPPTTPPTLMTSQLRRGLLSSVPLLPSKYNK